MRKLLFAIMLGLLVATPSFGQLRTIPALTEEKTAAPTLEDYEGALDHFKKFSKKVITPADWKGEELTNKKTKEVVKFESLSKFEQNMFCVGTGYRTMLEMKKLDEFWQEELKKFDDPKYVPVKKEKIENAKQNPAVKKDVENYLKQLTDVRKEMAKNYEKFVEKVMVDFKDEIPEKERETYLKQIRGFNDENKLIERKK